MEIDLLRDYLNSLTIDDAPAADFAEAVLEIAESGAWEKLRPFFGEAVEGLRQSYEADPRGFRDRMVNQAKSARTNLEQHAHRKLKDWSRFTYPNLNNLSGLEQIQRLLDSSDSLLQVAFAYKLVDLIDPAAGRARLLGQWLVNQPSSERADQYLLEACNCYYFGLFTACCVMCRSLIEEVLEQALPNDLMKKWKSERGTAKLTLGALMDKVNNWYPLPVPLEFPGKAEIINKVGSRAAHQEPVNGADALGCLQVTREALVLLLQ